MNFLILALATWRITNLFVWERGPYDIFGRLRNLLRIIRITLPDGKEINDSENELGKLFSCIWCLSPYIALVLFLINTTTVGHAIVTIFALSSVTIVVDKYLE